VWTGRVGLGTALTRLGREFFERYTPSVAKDLLGCRLVRVDKGRRLSGTIVETEAYRGRRDPASHAYRGKTSRNEVMFGPAGRAYVYFSMGMHYCLNVTTELPGNPGAVLLRALEPVEGVAEMLRNRGLDEPVHVADGPGRLTKALGIDMHFNSGDLITSEVLFIERGDRPQRIGISSRVGISKAIMRKWRFFVVGSSFVSSGRPAALPAQNP
jgi:DNA-3-methyladenine glycosylase